MVSTEKLLLVAVSVPCLVLAVFDGSIRPGFLSKRVPTGVLGSIYVIGWGGLIGLATLGLAHVLRDRGLSPDFVESLLAGFFFGTAVLFAGSYSARTNRADEVAGREAALKHQVEVAQRLLTLWAVMVHLQEGRSALRLPDTVQGLEAALLRLPTIAWPPRDSQLVDPGTWHRSQLVGPGLLDEGKWNFAKRDIQSALESELTLLKEQLERSERWARERDAEARKREAEAKRKAEQREREAKWLREKPQREAEDKAILEGIGSDDARMADLAITWLARMARLEEAGIRTPLPLLTDFFCCESAKECVLARTEPCHSPDCRNLQNVEEAHSSFFCCEQARSDVLLGRSLHHAGNCKYACILS